MHNTLVVDGRSQSIGKGPFSWKTMARSRVRKWTTHPAFDYFEGTHDGYWPIEHRRHVLTLPGDVMVVADRVSGDGTHTASVHWHVDPRWRVSISETVVTFATKEAQCQLVVPRGRIERFTGDKDSGLGWHAPVYGSVEPSTSLRITHCDTLPFWMPSVFGLTRTNAVVDVEFLPVTDGAGRVANAMALRIVRTSSTDYVMFAEPAVGNATESRRFGAFETDARVLFCRAIDGRAGDVILLDGSRVHVEGDAGLEFEAPHRMSHVHLAAGDAARVASRALI
jgi:hypothetical protein